MTPLYPEIQPYVTHRLAVSDLHELYIEECGEPDGIPVVVIHGGPGSGCSEQARRFFDPERYRIILFDQRGAGRSTPHAELVENDSRALVADMEAIRELLGVSQWLLFGGSWGSTLALLYGQAHPARVSAMILRGIFLCRDRDLRWLYQEGASRVFPDHWRDFLAPVAESERGDLLQAYHRLLTGGNELARIRAARAWSNWEGQLATLRPNSDVVAAFTEPQHALSLARIEAHYFVNKGFIAGDEILANVEKLADIPAILIHGRYDMVCPLDNATALNEVWSGSELRIIRESGHASSEPGIEDALLRATREMAQRLSR